MMSTISQYRPSKRPYVKDVSQWLSGFEDWIEQDWRGQKKHVLVEQGYPFTDFYRVTYTIDGVRKSKLFYGEFANFDVERYVADLGFPSVYGNV